MSITARPMPTVIHWFILFILHTATLHQHGRDAYLLLVRSTGPVHTALKIRWMPPRRIHWRSVPQVSSTVYRRTWDNMWQECVYRNGGTVFSLVRSCAISSSML